MKDFTHIDKNGQVNMVDVSNKDRSLRTAKVSGIINMNPDTIKKIKSNNIQKGNVIETARLAGISGSKLTSTIIPLCHNIPIDNVDINFEIYKNCIKTICKVMSTAKTGVEMEAFCAVNTALLTIYDMCKAIDRTMEICNVKLLQKTGGKTFFHRGSILSLNISKVKGIKKSPVEIVELIENFGIKNDAHAQKDIKKQISFLSDVSINKIRSDKLKINYGDFAENITVSDIPVYKFPIGTKITFNKSTAELILTAIGKQCHSGCEIEKTLGECVMPKEGIFACVTKTGILRNDDEVIFQYEN